MDTIGYFEAWSHWLHGEQINPAFVMGPLTILWWGRIGKIMAFLGGLTVVLDLVGPQRLRETGRAFKRWRVEWMPTLGYMGGCLVTVFVCLGGLVAFAWYLTSRHLLTPFIWMLGMWGTLAIGVLLYSIVLPLLGDFIDYLFVRVANSLDRPSPALGIRMVATTLILAGFHLDLLAS